RGWRWIVAPTVLGLGYFLLVMTFVVPAFVHLPAANCTGPVPVAQMDSTWPGSSNPNLGYYLHWGCTPGMIAWNLVKDPLYTVRYMLGDGQKWQYLADLLAPLAFLSLLAPGRLLLALPILGLNLIAWRPSQTDYRNHYQLLITVGVVAAAIAGYAILERLITWVRNLDLAPAGMEPRPDPTAADIAAEMRGMVLWRDGPLVALLVVAAGVNVLLHNPIVAAFRYPESPARIAAAERLIAAVPPAAQVAASSRVAPHLLPRQYIYNFPPAPYSPYTMTDFRGLDYILVDLRASGNNDSPQLPADRTALQVLAASSEWTLLADAQDYRLYRRTHK
ncbi:MAG TPA: DUF2079 domain-containing protein, partial [Chloroflexia bacterium]|nr:DUF2079 domain-containing protein [Chloroflexia bacterium]